MADLKITADYSELTGLIKTTDQSKRAIQLLGNTLANTKDSSSYMRGINQVVEAQKKLAPSARMSRSEIMKLGMQMKQEADFAKALAAATAQAGVATGNLGKRMNRAGVLTQQAGYQLGDFIVQVQSGTNAFVAFGQQATQVAGTLTLLGGKWIAIGSALGVAIPLITAAAAAFMRTRQEADKSGDSLSDLEQEIKSIDRTLQEFKRNQKAGALGISPEMFASEEALSAAKAARDAMAKSLEEAYAIAESTEPFALKLLGYLDPTLNEKPPWLKTLEESYLELNAKVEAGEQRIRDLREKNATEAAQKAKELSQERTSDYEAEIKATERLIQLADLQARGYSKATAEIAVILNQKGEELKLLRDAGLLTEEQAQAEYEAARAAAEKAQQYEDIVKPALEFMQAVRDAKGDAETLAGLNLQSGILAAAQEAGVLSDNMLSALRNALALVGLAKAESENKFMKLYNSGAFTGTPNVSGYQSPEYHNLLDRINNPSAYASSRGGRGGGGGKDPAEAAAEYLEKLQREADFKLQLVGLSEQEQRGMEIKKQYLETLEQDNRALTDAEQARIDAILKSEEALKKATEAEQRREEIQQSITSNIEDALMSVVEGTQSVEDAFKGMLRNILLEIYRQQVAQPFAKNIGTFITSLFNANGNVFQNGAHVQAYANGGVVDRATAFPMRGGVGVMGEAGPEAIMPLKRGKNGKLGVQMEGGGDIHIVQNYNFQANGDESVKRIISQETPKIMEMTKAAVADTKRRGGGYGRAFG